MYNLRVYFRRGLDVHNTSFVYVYFGDVAYVEYRKDSLLSWDTLLGKLDI